MKPTNFDYKHTEIGKLTLGILAVVGILVALIMVVLADDVQWWVVVVSAVLFAVILALFYALTVEISDGMLKFWFGIGLIRKSYPLREIQSTEEVETPWYYTWGIKTIPGGILYAIAPGSGVEVVFKDGKMILLGTDQPAALKRALDDAIAEI